MHKYAPLDGLRGLSILLVLAHHLYIPGFFNGGFLGVDLFFILSGFLITQIIVREYQKTNDFSYKTFYYKRFLRLGPPLLLVMGSMIALHLATNAFYMGHGSFFGREILIPLLGLSHLCRAFEFYPPQLMGHTWSLSFEQQFYLFWPALTLYFARKKQLVLWQHLTLALILICFALKPLENALGISHAYIGNSLEGRGSAILAGSWIALLRANGQQIPIRSWIQWVALVCIFILSLGAERFPNLTINIAYSLCAICGVILVLATIQRQIHPWIQRILSNSILRGFGLISYSLYLWHFPLIGIANLHNWPMSIRIGILIPMSIGLSVLSWIFLEKKLYQLRQKSTISETNP